MFLSCWLTSVRNLFSQRGRRGLRRPARRRGADAHQQLEQLEPRQVMACDFVSAFSNVGAFITEGGVEREAPQQITVKFSPGVKIDPATIGTGISITRIGADGIAGSSDDITIPFGSISVDDSPNQNQVVLRFAETLPDDSYRLTISGAGAGGLKTLAQGTTIPAEKFRAGGSFDLNFRLDLGAQVVSVVPQPLTKPKLITFGTDITQYKDGDLLSVAIRGARQVFEFDTDGKVAGGNIALSLAGKSAAGLAAEVAAKINADPGLAAEVASATVVSGTSRINLRGTTFTPVVGFTRAGSVPLSMPLAIAEGPALAQSLDKVVVYFNANDPLSQASASNPRNYRLIETNPLTAADLSIQVPQSVSYEAVSGSAVLVFESGKVAADKTYRLQVGNSSDENNLLTSAVNVGSIFQQTGYSVLSFLGDGTELANDVDLYRWNVTAGGAVSIALTPDATLNPLLRLFDSTGAEITSGVTITGTGVGVARLLTYTAPAAGMYYVGVSSVGNGGYNAATGTGAAGGTTRGGYSLSIASAVAVAASDTNSSFATAANLGSLGKAGQTVTAAIDVRATVPTPVGNLNFPSQPGSLDEPGHVDIPVGGESHGVGPLSVGPAAQIPVMYYNFQDLYGTDPQGNPLHNVITENQKQRAREIFDAFSRASGVRFVESLTGGITVVTGDVRAVSPSVPVTAVAGISGGMAVMNSSIDWGESVFGGYWQSVAMHEIGHSIGLGHAYDIPSVMGGAETAVPGSTAENILPFDYDVVHLNDLYPRTGSDIDVYKFTLDGPGALTAQTFVARPGQAVLSTLDTVLTLYREDSGVRTMVARNDNYYGRDSFIGLDLAAGNYFLAVTAAGNTGFNPDVSDSGYAGQSDGAYKLKLDFTPLAAVANTLVDATGTPFDGDRDGIAGGAFNTWFQTATAAGTIFVDKTGANTQASITAGSALVTVASNANLVLGSVAVGVGIPAGAVVQSLAGTTQFTLSKPATATNAAAVLNFGTLASPYKTIKDALAASNASTRIIRIVGNTGNDATPSDEKAYLIGTTLAGAALADGATFNVPQGVTVMVDAGAVIKLRAANIDVGSSSPLVSRAGAALQVLGTPASKVVFTSYHDDSISGDSDGVGPAVQGGQWGGIVLRQDSDSATKALFLNSISQSTLRYGGGNVFVDSRLQSFAPLHLVSTRPTLAFNEVLFSAGAGISANPNAFEDSNGRYGPEVHGNRLLANSVNGLFVRIDTNFGSPIDVLDVPARFKSTDITYVIQENLMIAGGAGGYDATSGQVLARATGRLLIDPGVVVKLLGARIELERGNAQLIAEGTPGQRVIFTSFADNRFGAGGTFDTNGNSPDVRAAGDWGGIIVDAGAQASIDNAYLAYGGGQASVEGGFGRFNVLEVQQGQLRVANSRIENNASGESPNDRNSRGTNAAATIFARGAQPVIVGNDFRDNLGALVSINANSLSDVQTPDPGRSTGRLARFEQYDDNVGPLVRGNRLSYTINAAAGRPAGGAIGGMQVRPEQNTVESVWDDVDIVYVLMGEILVDNFHTATGIRLLSATNASLVVKLQGAAAGFTATGTASDIDDRIGGTVQVLGQPGYPVIMTSLRDDTVGASLDALGATIKDTNNDGAATVAAAGDWRSLQFMPLSNDTNVAIIQETEAPQTGKLDINQSVVAAQVLGVLAPNFTTGVNTTDSSQNKGGDENRRDGFEVHGHIAADDTTDVDTYSFAAYAGSEVWIEIDKSSPALDTMLELLDAGGNVLARSADSQTDTGTVRGEVISQPSATTSVVYQLAHANVLPGTLSGMIYAGNIAVQTFTVDRTGRFTFTPIGLPANSVTAGVLDGATGKVTFTWVAATANRIEIGYGYAGVAVATLGYTATGANGVLPMEKNPLLGGDFYTTNPRDAGMRVILPGTPGTPAQYFIRVRSQPQVDPSTAKATYEATLVSNDNVNSGATSGQYELRVRLQQRDQKPGSTVQYADIRDATVGIDVHGLPRNSQLVGTTGDPVNGSNVTFGSAQPTGKLLQSDQNSISIAGSLAGSGDVHWYSFSLDYATIQAIAGVNGGGKTWATVLDLDYGSGFRGDYTMSVYDSSGKLIYVGRDSTVAADQPGSGQGTDLDNLAAGSVGVLDPYIGTIQLPTGATPSNPTVYYVAISTNATLPSAMDGTFKAGATSALVRLEPVDSVARVIEDHIGSTGYTSQGTTIAPTQGALINVANAQQLSANVRAFSLADVPLFVSTGNAIVTANALTGAQTTTLQVGYGDGGVGDIDMRPDGSLYQYFGQNGDDGNVGHLRQIDTGTGAVLSDAGDAIAKVPDSPGADDFWKLTSSSVDAVAIGLTGVGKYENEIFYSVRNGGESLLYWARTNGNASYTKGEPYSLRGPIADATGAAPQTETVVGTAGTSATYQLSTAYIGTSLSGTLFVGGVAAQTFTASGSWMNFTDVAGYSGPKAFYGIAEPDSGKITIYYTSDPGATSIQATFRASAISGLTTGLQFRNENGQLYGVSAGGQFFTVSPGSGAAALVADFATKLTALGDGSVGFQGLATAPVNLENGRYAGMFFAITNTGRLVCIDVANKKLLENVFDNNADGVPESAISSPILSGATGLAFSPMDVNAWHPTTARGGDAGHGISAAPDNSRTGDDIQGGGTSMYFGVEEYAGSPNTYDSFNPTGTNGQYGVSGAGGYNWQQELTANTQIGNNYNTPGGTAGSLITNSFSLAGYTYTDKPALYFNYFLDTPGAAGNNSSNTMRDSARVFLSVDNGLTWVVVATNNSTRSDIDTVNAELPNTITASSKTGTAGNQAVQELFDSTGTWRQARVDLGKWAGKSNIQLRFDFSTAGMMDAAALRTTPDETKPVTSAVVSAAAVTLGSVSGLRVGMVVTGPGIVGEPKISSIDSLTQVTLSSAVTLAAGDSLKFFDLANRLINKINGVANTDGNLGSSERGQKNAYEGFYVDDFIVGFAERGEMVTGASVGVTSSFSVATPSSKTYPEQALGGAYQVEIRRGTEYAAQPDPSKKDIAIGALIDTNDSLTLAAAAPAKVLDVNLVDAIAAGVLTKAGNGRVTFPAAGLLAAAGITPPAGTTVAILDSSTLGTVQNNLLAWNLSPNLVNEPKAVLEFQYLSAPRQGYAALPPTFTTPLVGGQRNLPSGNGVAISGDGGLTWTTVAALGNTFGQWSKVRLDLKALGITYTATTQIGFFQSGDRQVDLTGGSAVSAFGGLVLDAFRITVDAPPTTTGTIGDENVTRRQGQFIIANNIITSAATYGINIDAGSRDPSSGAPNPGVVRNLAVINDPALVAGVVAVNNIVARSGSVGIRFSGDAGGTGGPAGAVPYGRIINNTIYGTGQSSGISVENNAAPTILNNLFANLNVGVFVDPSSRVDGAGNLRTVVGTSAYYKVTKQVSGTQESSGLVITGNPFVNADKNNFYLVSGAAAIDSAINSLQDRTEYTAVNGPVGIAPSPVIAPELDLYGQLRGDDPSQGSAPGLGSNVFKDRGAVDRVDFTQPTLVITEPLDQNAAAPVDQDPDPNAVRLERADALGVTQFVLQLNDLGVGIDKTTVVVGAFAMTRDGVPLVAGTDYVWRYIENTNQVIFESVSVYPLGTYLITATSRPTATGLSGWLTDLANNTILPNKTDGSTTFQIALADIPTAPLVVAGVRDQIGGVVLSWNAPASNGGTGILDYIVQWSSDNGSTWTTFADGVAAATGATVSGLVVGTSYVFRVNARNAVNDDTPIDDAIWSAKSAAVKVLLPASAPTLTSATAGNTVATLAWTVPTLPGGASISDYAIEYSTDGENTWATYPDGVSTATSATLTGLTNGLPYIFRVRAVTEYGLGTASASSSPVIPMTVPVAPIALAAKVGDTAVDLTWADQGNGGSVIIDHLIQYSSDAGATWTTFNHPALTATKITVTSLTNGTSYVFQVAAVNEKGPSAFSNLAGPVTPVAPPSQPLALVGSWGNTLVNLAWAAPATDGGGEISNYVIEYQQVSPAGGWTIFAHLPSSALSATVTGLTNGIPYRFRVSGVNAAGVGAVSDLSNVVTPMTIASAPTITSATSGNAAVLLAWLAPTSNGGALVTDYSVEYRVNTPGALWTTFNHAPSAATSILVNGLINGTTYVLRVSALNAAGTSPASNISTVVMPVTAPSVPLNLLVIAGDRQASLIWTKPSSDGGLPISDYVIEYRRSTDLGWTVFKDGVSTVPSATLTGLVNGISYLFRVSALSSFGAGPTADSSPITPVSIPGVPTIPTLAAGNAKVTLTWQAPSDTGGTPITDYVIEYRKPTEIIWTTFQHAASAATTIDVTGLTVLSSYLFRVSAKNMVGAGSPSAASSAILVVAAPGVASAVTATAGNAQATVKWTAPTVTNGSPITDYLVEFRKTTDSAWTPFVRAASSVPSAVVTGLVNGLDYVFRVTAINALGAGLPSSVTSPPVRPLGPPAAPTNVNGTGFRGTVSLNWTAPTDNGGAAVIGYVVRYRLNNPGAAWVTKIIPLSTATSATLTGFTTRYGHVFSVAAKTSVGQGAWSAESVAFNPFG